jgi:hypothetical protein
MSCRAAQGTAFALAGSGLSINSPSITCAEKGAAPACDWLARHA